MKKRYPLTLMAGPCIPWTDDFQLDEPSLRREIRFLAEAGITSMYFFGTAGEGYVLDRKLFGDITGVILDEASQHSGLEPMIGVISTSMPEIIERIGIANGLGARDFQVALPCWGAMSEDNVRYFWGEVCRSFPDCRFMAYNNQNRTKTGVTVAEYLRIADENPNFVAVKYSTPNIFQIYDVAVANTELTFFIVDMGYEYASMFGKVGLISSYISIDSEAVWEYFNAGQRGDFQVLSKNGRYIMELNSAFDAVEGDYIDAAYDKAIVSITDPDFSYRIRPPYSGLSKEEFDRVKALKKDTISKFNAGRL